MGPCAVVLRSRSVRRLPELAGGTCGRVVGGGGGVPYACLPSGPLSADSRRAASGLLRSSEALQRHTVPQMHSTAQ